MGFGLWTMRPANDVLKRLLARISLGTFLLLALSFSSVAETQKSVSQCQKPIYLTFDTGHMGVAPLIAEVLRKHRVPVTFFGANEKTQEGDGSLGLYWSAWWKERASEGHDFASHTFDHAYWRADIDSQNFKIRPSAGEQKDQNLLWRAEDYCANLKKASQRLEAMTGRASLPLFRAPGGKTSPALLKAASQCGYTHVGWSPAGFLGDELSSQTYSNEKLLRTSLQSIKTGDVLMAHLGIWSRQDPWAPAVLEPLIVGLKEKGFCFARLRQHPQYSKLLSAVP
jgi:peptidoglycan/xylan/chitin deacetylase (PgdA/CDA1 family)